jgi:hypothetical protein
LQLKTRLHRRRHRHHHRRQQRLNIQQKSGLLVLLKPTTERQIR